MAIPEQFQARWNASVAGLLASLACVAPATALELAVPKGRLECVADVYPPYTIERAGVVSGMGAEQLIEAGRLVGLDIVIKILPFARIENELRRGAESAVMCAYAFSRTDARESYMLFGNVPTSTNSYVLYAKAGKASLQYQGAPTLKGVRIGVRHAFRVPDVIKEALARGDVSIESVIDDELNFRKLNLDRVDYVLTNQDVGETMIRRLGLADVKALSPAVAEFQTFVVFNKAAERATFWRDAIDKGLQEVRANRTEQRLRAQYLR